MGDEEITGVPMGGAETWNDGVFRTQGQSYDPFNMPGAQRQGP